MHVFVSRRATRSTSRTRGSVTAFRVAPAVRSEHRPPLAAARLGTRLPRLDVETGGNLFKADLTQLRATCQFNVRTFVRAIIQYQPTSRNPELYIVDRAAAESQSLCTQLLFSYKLNPQTVLFVGYSSTRFGNDSFDYAETDRTLSSKWDTHGPCDLKSGPGRPRYRSCTGRCRAF